MPAQGFEPWTIGLKDRRSNQAELRRLKMIFPVFSRLHRSPSVNHRGKEGAAWLGRPSLSSEPLIPRRPDNRASPSSGRLAACPGHGGNRGRCAPRKYAFAANRRRRLDRVAFGP